MAIAAAHIHSTLTAYLTAHPEDEASLLAALEILDTGGDLTSRKEFRGHVTAGAILANSDGRILHIHHLALSK